MNRRQFLGLASTVSLAYFSRATISGTSPEVAFTFDDPRLDGGAGLRWQDINERILHALAARRLRASLFVTGMRIDQSEGAKLISQWDQAGHAIANHSYSHLYFNAGGTGGDANTTLAKFEADALRNEPLIARYGHFTRLFRFPYFKEGDTAEKRDGMRAFLKKHGYRIGRASIDASDWAISSRMESRAKQNSRWDLTPYRDFFLEHIWERSQFYDSLARRLLGRSVRHTVVLHHNPLNALFLADLMEMFTTNGWKLVDSEYAYADEVYNSQPRIVPAGESLIWALAKESGRFESDLRYPGEDDVYENPKMDARKL
jgi:peptidoglycan/xylan/chitin deacetylase (PgdA/CDA1 family)